MLLRQCIAKKHRPGIFMGSVLGWWQRPEDIEIRFVTIAIHVVRRCKIEDGYSVSIFIELTKRALGTLTAYQSHARYVSIITGPLHLDLVVQLRVYIPQRGRRVGAWMGMIPAHQRNALPFHGPRDFSFYCSCS